MLHKDDGLGIARERIAEEARSRTGSLDLGMLGLHELPVELFALTHLRRLNLGLLMEDEAGDDWVQARSHIAPNSLNSELARLAVLANLTVLSVARTALTTLAGITRTPRAAIPQLWGNADQRPPAAGGAHRAVLAPLRGDASRGSRTAGRT